MIKNSSAQKVDLKSADELFNHTSKRSEFSIFNTIETQREMGQEISLSQIDGFPNHPFRVINDESMQELVESIKTNGLIHPAIVRKKEDGRYELVSGHRRKMACELAGLEKMAVIVRELDKDAATITMVDSNMQREQILPSEKAFAYKMRLEAMKRQAGRPSIENGDPMGPHLIKGKSASILAEKTGDSSTQIKRYIRLTELSPEILKKVDDKSLGFQPAVELSYLSEQEQQNLLETMECEERTPSLAQAQRMKKMSTEGRLSMDAIFAVMTEEKPNEKEKFSIPRKSIESYIPRGLTREKEVEYVAKALEFYQRYLQRQREKNLAR